MKFAKKMNGYGFRVQKSAFEAMISESLYRRLLQEIPAMIDSSNDSIRVYKIHGYGEVSLFGENIRLKNEEVMVNMQVYERGLVNYEQDNFIYSGWGNRSDIIDKWT